jgi:uncharacterized membrane protein
MSAEAQPEGASQPAPDRTPRWTPAQRAAVACIAGLVLVQFAWHGPGTGGDWLAAAVYALPLLWLALLVAARRRGAFFWAGVLALPYLCHGVAEAWAAPADRLPALAESVLAGALALCVSWDGLRARRAARRAAGGDDQRANV